MFNTREDMREPASELYALVVSSATSQQRCVEIMLELTENLDKQVMAIIFQFMPGNRLTSELRSPRI